MTKNAYLFPLFFFLCRGNGKFEKFFNFFYATALIFLIKSPNFAIIFYGNKFYKRG